MPRKHQCQICKHVLSRSTTLRAHLRTHTGERPFTCSHCDKAFARQWDLEAHTKTHDEEPKYVCDGRGPGIDRDGPISPGCGTAFLRKRDLMRHLKSINPSKCAAAAFQQQEQASLRRSEGVREVEAAEVLTHLRHSPALSQLNQVNHHSDMPNRVSTTDAFNAAKILNKSLRGLFIESYLVQSITGALYSIAKLASFSSAQVDLHRNEIYARAVRNLQVVLHDHLRDPVFRESLILGTALLVVIEFLSGTSPQTRRMHITGLSKFRTTSFSDDLNLIHTIHGIGYVLSGSNAGLIHSYAYTGTHRESINLILFSADKCAQKMITPELFAVLCGVVLLDPLEGKDVLARFGEVLTASLSKTLPESEHRRMIAHLLLDQMYPDITTEGFSKLWSRNTTTNSP